MSQLISYISIPTYLDKPLDMNELFIKYGDRSQYINMQKLDAELKVLKVRGALDKLVDASAGCRIS